MSNPILTIEVLDTGEISTLDLHDHPIEIGKFVNLICTIDVVVKQQTGKTNERCEAEFDSVQCPRCGTWMDVGLDWDVINCIDCGEFIENEHNLLEG